MCGAVIKIPHTGDCHFGWHNPKTCPTERVNKITVDEKKEVEDMILGEVDRIIQDGGWAAQNIIKYLKSIGYRADGD